MEKKRVLFLCTGNSARSQMAEALLRRQAGDFFEVFSAGLEPRPIHPFTLQVMEETGCDMRGQFSKPLSFYIGKVHFDYLITVCSQAEEKCPYFPGSGIRLHWPFDDPAQFHGSSEDTLHEFRRVRDQISKQILEWLREQGIHPVND